MSLSLGVDPQEAAAMDSEFESRVGGLTIWAIETRPNDTALAACEGGGASHQSEHGSGPPNMSASTHKVNLSEVY